MYSNGPSSYNQCHNFEESTGDPLLESSIISGPNLPYVGSSPGAHYVGGSNSLVSYNRFKNTSGVGIATGIVRRSLNEMTQQMRKSKEMHELMLERKNIENMIVNSKLWSPTFQSNMDGGLSSTTAT
jgi:hypothetical protein